MIHLKEVQGDSKQFYSHTIGKLSTLYCEKDEVIYSDLFKLHENFEVTSISV